MSQLFTFLPLEEMEYHLGQALPIKRGGGLSESDPLLLYNIHKSNVPEFEHAVIKFSLERYGLRPATGISQQLSNKNGRWIEKIELKFNASGIDYKYAYYLRVYFDLTEIMD